MRGATCIARPLTGRSTCCGGETAAANEPLDSAAGVASQGRGSRPEAEAASSELVQWLRTALGELSPRAAEMFTLRYVEELDNREIAALMNTSQAVVAVTLHQARAKLKKRLSRDGTGEAMKNQDEVLLDSATQAMREAEPEAGQISAAAEKVAGRLGIAFADQRRLRAARMCGRCSLRIARGRWLKIARCW